MTDEEYEFTLTDRIAKIKSLNEQVNLEENAYISFSGGKDSCVLSRLFDLALPDNKIPRVYGNTGIEYIDMVKYVRERQKEDSRFIIVNQKRKIRSTLDEYGYPFKSKMHSMMVRDFNKGSEGNYIKKYISRETHTSLRCPDILLYQFEERKKYNFSNQCCYKLKKDLLHDWEKENNKIITITGMRRSEGGNRRQLTCITDKGKKFHPLIVVNEEWEEEFIKRENIVLCKLYYPPYNIERTGCKGCPFSLNLKKNLEMMKKLLPIEYNACLTLWKPVYDEYVRLGYRLDKNFYEKPVQYNMDDYLLK